jgi:hypothetical protein
VTARRLALGGLPHWPRFLSLSQAAAYVGVSPGVFLTEVKDKVWPDPLRRGSKEALATWDKALMDAAADKRSGIGSATQVVIEPPVLDLAGQADELRKRLRAETGRRRAK